MERLSFNDLLNKYRKLSCVIKFGYCILGFAAFCLIKGLVSMSDVSVSFPFIIIGFGSLFLFMIIGVLALSKNREFQNMYESYVRDLLSKHIHNMKWKGYSIGNRQQFSNLLINGLITGHSTFSGTFKDADMYFCDLKHREDINNSQVSPFASKGQYYELVAPYTVQIPIRIAAMKGKKHKVFLTKRTNERRVDLENMLFNKEFEIYTSQELNGFYVLNPLVMEKLLTLKKQYGEFVMYFNQNRIQCFIKTDREILTINMDILRDKNFTLQDIKNEIIGISETMYDVHNSLSKSVVRER